MPAMGMETMRAGSSTITVQSTMPTGATCAINDAVGNAIGKHAQFPADGSASLAEAQPSERADDSDAARRIQLWNSTAKC